MNADVFKTGLSGILAIAKDFLTVSVKDGIVRIGATNDTHSIVFEAEMPDATENVRFVLNIPAAKQLQKSIKGKTVTFLVEDEKSVKVICAKSKSTLAVESLGVLTFKKLLHFVERDKQDFGIDGGLFSSALNKIRGNMDDKEVGDVRFRGLHMRLENGSMELMASNGKTMSFTKVPAQYEGDRITYVLNSQFDDLAKYMVGQVAVRFLDKVMTIVADAGDIRYYMSTVILPVPPVPYEQKVDEVEKIEYDSVEVNRKLLLELMKSNEFYTDSGKKRKIIVDFYADAIQVNASNDIGESVVTIDGDDLKNATFTEPKNFILSIDNVIRALNLSSQETVKISLNRTGLPLVFKDDFVTTIVSSYKNY